MEHSRTVEDAKKDLEEQLKTIESNFVRQNEENNTLIAMTTKEKYLNFIHNLVLFPN